MATEVPTDDTKMIVQVLLDLLATPATCLEPTTEAYLMGTCQGHLESSPDDRAAPCIAIQLLRRFPLLAMLSELARPQTVAKRYEDSLSK